MTRWSRRCLVAAMILAAGCGSTPSQPTPPDPPPNPAPVIASINASRARVEVGESVEITATVTDGETPLSELTFEWTASIAGTFEGTGGRVTWRPAETIVTPARVDITLTVIERYAVAIQGGFALRENRSSAATIVNVNNSPKEVRDLALAFLNDFANSANSPEYCVRNFTDSCRGKAAEAEDIRIDREKYVIASSNVRVERVDFTGGPGEPGVAYIYAPCTFVSVRRDTGEQLPPSTGICALTAVYEPYRWWLCTSNWCNSYDVCSPFPNISTSLVRSLRR
ncbi:MAG TPA: hypothetical protein VK886_08585 [Vicinamibacterales bacterium]|nr:hypothetical protein [Vicinamibacterales bacterium]